MYASDLARKVAVSFGIRLVLIGVGLLTSALVTRALGPDGRGLFAAATTLGAIGVQFSNIGLHVSNSYTSAREPHLAPALFANTLWVSLGLGGMVALGTGLAFVLRPDMAPVQGVVLLMALIWIPPATSNMMLGGLLLGMNRVQDVNQSEVVIKMLTLILSGLLLYLQCSSVEAMLLAAWLALVGGVGFQIHRIAKPLESCPHFSWPLLKGNLQYGLRAYFCAILTYIVLRIDVLMVEHYLGHKQTGYYAIAVQFADMLSLLPVTIGTLAFPRMSAIPESSRRRLFAGQVAVGTGLATLLLSVTLAVFSKWIIISLFGAEFAPAVPALLWLLPGIVLLSINSIFMNYYGADGFPPIAFLSPASAALLNIVLNIILLPRMGIVGASIASTVAYLLMILLSLIQLILTRKTVRNTL